MLADETDYVIGGDSHRDTISLAVVASATGAVIAEQTVKTTPHGYRAALRFAQQHALGRRVFALEGTGCYAAGLTRYLQARRERVVEIDAPRRRRGSARDKDDAGDAVLAARTALGDHVQATPRAQTGTRQALRQVLAAHQGAANERRDAVNQLRALIVTAPDGLRDQLRGLARGALIARCRQLRLHPAQPPELRGAIVSLRSLARRIQLAEHECRLLLRELSKLVKQADPTLLDQLGIGPINAAQMLISWSHPDRCRSEAAFARLAGCAPITASSGQNQRHRLDWGGDRQLNRALHTIAHTRARHDPHTRDYLDRRRAEGKTPRQAMRCLKRYLARSLYRHLQHHATPMP